MDPTNTQNHYTFTEGEASLVIDISQLWQAFLQQGKTIGLVTLMFFLVGGVYAFCLFDEKYRSDATVLFSPTELPTVVSSVDTLNMFFKGKGIEVSPFKNQEELLKSKLIAKRIYQDLKSDGLKLSANNPEDLIEKNLIVSHVRNTDFIRIAAVSDSPSRAQQITKSYLENYLELMNEISYTPLLQQKALFEQQSKQADQVLAVLNKKIQTYQETYNIIDIAREGQIKVGELADLSTSRKTIEANLAEKKAEIGQIRRQLKLNRQDITTAIQAVANGQDSILTGLQDSLNEAEKEYNIKALTYSVSNPEMEQLQEKINVLKKQITDRQILSVGITAPKAIIRDEVRTDLISRLASRESEYSALQNKLAAIRTQTGSLQSELKLFPEQQIEYANLLLEKRHREDIQTKLRQKLSEIQIQEGAVKKKLMVIDQPSLPALPLFPSRWHIVILSGLVGFAMSAVAVMGHTLMRPHAIRPEEIERGLSLPVLAVIPWLPPTQWQRNRNRNTLEVLASPVHAPTLKAYQNCALNLKAQRNLNQKNTFVVSALTKEAKQSVILANLAFCLAQSGESVVLVETNLRNPQLHQSFGHNLNYEKGIPELINSISEYLFKKETVETADILPLVKTALTPSGIHNQLHYLNAGVELENTFEFLNSKGFSGLVSTLKAHYDWVLFDAPPFLNTPDAAVLLGYVDGLLLFVERDAEESQIQAAQRKVQKLNSSVLGCVLREPFK